MKKIIVSLSALFLCAVAPAQLKTTVRCPVINIDILDGIVNGNKITQRGGRRLDGEVAGLDVASLGGFGGNDVLGDAVGDGGRHDPVSAWQ